MLRLSKSLYNQPVLSMRSGGQIGRATEPIFNPHNLKIVGWWCISDNPKPVVLLFENIREAMPHGLAVDDHDDLSEPEDLVRYHDILDADFKLIDKPVKTKHQKLGRVEDYSYNDGMFVQKLYVGRPLRKVLASDATLVIDRDQILEVTDHHILVKDTDLKATQKELADARQLLSPQVD